MYKRLFKLVLGLVTGFHNDWIRGRNQSNNNLGKGVERQDYKIV